ncbi:hypothetical protein ACH5RR_011266 [Cinchona calisaya]|uniref:Uncharacterized protein n=1 Tax=Cinchona calisaya TaxID=153742 RepID=A0ABD3A4D9_9GENT
MTLEPVCLEQVEEDEDINNVAKSYSDQSDGVVSFDELSVNPSNGGMEQNVSKELSSTSPGTKEIYVLRISKKDSNTAASSRWWWDPFGILPRSPSKPKASTAQEGLQQFPIQKIRKATNNFHYSFIIGFGGSDSVYKGHIDGIERVVAIRRSKSTRWLDEDQVSLAQWIKSGLRNNLSGYIDPYLTGKIAPECFRMFIEAASKCLLDKGIERPSLSDIVASLESALEQQEAADRAEDVLSATS